MQALYAAMALCGSAVTLYSMFIYPRRARSAQQGSTGLAAVLVRLMMGLAAFCFAAAAVFILRQKPAPLYAWTGGISLAVSLLVLLLTVTRRSSEKAYAARMDALETASQEAEAKSGSLREEVDIRAQEVLHQEKLLRTVNETASILLASDVATFEASLWQCMGMLAESVVVDRVYIWKNHMKNGVLYCTQLYEWSEGTEPQQGNDLTVDVPFPETWYPKLSTKQCVNGTINQFDGWEQEHLRAQGIVSILVVPVFFTDQFWGFVGFDDCQNERTFTSADEAILRSASLLIATAMLRNETTVALVQSREEAIFTTKSKSDFLSNMSHEIRTPINAITGMTAIARKTDDNERMHQCLDKIDAASRQLLGLVNDILDMNKIEAGKMDLSNEPFDLRATIGNMKSIIGVRAGEKNQVLTVKVAEDVPNAVLGDEMRLSQILINLLSNAVKFTPEYGQIDLIVQLIEQRGDLYLLEAKVLDTGIGISDEQQMRLFLPFEQAERTISRNYGGTGLGLAISKRLANLMHGDIAVESALGKGSSFTVTFLLQEGNERWLQTEKERDAVQDSDFTGRIALLAEDIEINREIAVSLLEETGMKVDVAENGQIALEMFAAQPARYDIIFMDLHMPVMDGYAATRAIRRLDLPEAATVPIVAMTANAFAEDVRRCLAAGMNDHIAKPIDINRLYQLVETHMRKA